ncbi:MAG: SxtJ family membrane protein [Xenococcaceae cyanobacterium]
MDQIPKLNRKELRDFGLLTGAIVAILFGLVLPWLRGHSLPQIPWIIAAILWFFAVLAPATLKPVYQVWMRIGLVLGWVNTRIILGIVFYGLIMPMGAIMRLFNRDPMARKFEVELQTYRLPSLKKTRASMEKPY